MIVAIWSAAKRRWRAGKFGGIVYLSGIFLFPLVAIAQDSHDWGALQQLKSGERVAVSLKAHRTTEGIFQSWSQQEIVLDSGTLPKEAVRKISRYRKGVWSRGKTALVGAGIGGGAGLAIGLAAGGGCGHSFGPCFSRGEVGGVFAGIGAILGAGIGALIPHRRLDLIYSSSN